MDEQALRKLLLTAFEYSYLHDSWVNPLSEALEGITASQAQVKLTEKCIWEIVLHLAVWNENIMERVRTGLPSRPTEGHWPALPSDLNSTSWSLAQKRLWDSLDLVRGMIEAEPVTAILNGPWGYEDLACRFTHMAYHIGQITVLKELV